MRYIIFDQCERSFRVECVVGNGLNTELIADILLNQIEVFLFVNHAGNAPFGSAFREMRFLLKCFSRFNSYIKWRSYSLFGSI